MNGRNEHTRILKNKVLNQINNIKDSLKRLLDKETGTLGERIKNLFREQGITIVSILTAFGMAIGVMVEALLPGGGSAAAAAAASGGDKPSGKGGAKEWIKNKLKALAGLLGKLAGKAAAAALPGIIGSVVAWILNRAKDAIGWLSQNVWALITGIGVLIYTYFMTRKRG